MTKQEADFIGSMNMCDEISNEAYKKIMCNCEVEESQLCEDCISRESLRQKLQEHHDFFVNAYGSYRDMTFKEKARVDEIDNCIAMVVNAPSVTPQQKVGKWIKTYEPNDAEPFILWECESCGLSERIKTHYCPNCGSYNGGEENV